MNLKDFKKVSEDDHKAVLQNSKGHSFTIAKKALEKKHLQALKDLPLHAAEGSFVSDFEDGAPEPEQASGPTPEEKASLSDYQSKQEVAPDEGIAPQPREVAASPVAQPAAPQPEPQPQAPLAEPAANAAADTYRKTYDQFNAEHAEQFAKEDAMYAHDLSNGHITPQTYGALFAKKDTLGKIGTLFGLLLSGAGSGLSGQPNAVLQMMNKEIDNDLDAQKTSKANALNFLRINQANELNKANIEKIGQETKRAKVETAGANIENEIKTQTLAKNQMLLSVLHSLQLGSDKIPSGSPLKGQYLQTLNGVQQIGTQEIQQNNQKAAAQLAGISQAEYESKTAKFRAAEMAGLPGGEMMARDRESKEIPGIGYSNTPIDKDVKNRIVSITNFQNLIGEYRALMDKVGRARGDVGILTPSEKARAQGIRNDLISSYNDVKGLTRFTGNEEELYKNIVPVIGKMNLTDSQRDLLNRLDESVQTKKDLEFKTAGIRHFSDSDSVDQHKKEIAGDKEGATGVSKSGKPIVFKGGKWVYK